MWNADTPEELDRALSEARDERGTCVIISEIEPHRYGPSSEVWWDVAPAETSDMSETQAARRNYVEERRQLQRLHY